MIYKVISPFVWISFFCVSIANSMENKERPKLKDLPEKYRNFIPTKENSGGGSPNNTGLDEINCQIMRMIAGYKDVCWEYWDDSEDIVEEFMPLEKFGIETIIYNAPLCVHSPHKSVIFYTPRGRKNALLLKKHMRKFAKKYNKKYKLGKGFKDEQHYLVGYLLGYPLENIKYFYEKGGIQEDYEKDKRNAEKFIECYSENIDKIKH